MKIIGFLAVKDDKTTLVGTGDVVIKYLLLTEMIKKRKEKSMEILFLLQVMNYL